MTVTLKNIDGDTAFSQVLEPVRGQGRHWD